MAAAGVLPWSAPAGEGGRWRLGRKHETLIAIAIVAGSLGLIAAAESDGFLGRGCRASPFRLAFGERVEAIMHVRGGAACSIRTAASNASIDELAITRAPENGALAARGRTGVIYTAAPRFKGDDWFEFALRGRMGQTRGVSTVRVHVTAR